MRSAVADTSFVFALINEEDKHHSDALELFEGLDRVYIPTLVVHELVWLLRRLKVDLGAILELMSNEKIEVVSVTAEDIAYALVTLRHPYDYNDLVIYSVSRRLNADFLTYDEEFIRRYINSGVVD